jgi:phosphoenolpyruvate-protein kinase (PTS system EI component)
MNKTVYFLKGLVSMLKGGEGSGNFNHAGIPGEQGGSAPGTGGATAQNTIDRVHTDAKARLAAAEKEQARLKAAITRTKEQTKKLQAARTDRERSNKITSQVSEWGHKNNVTGADTQASIERHMREKNMSLKDAVQRTYEQQESKTRRAIGDELFEQMVREGTIKRPAGYVPKK